MTIPQPSDPSSTDSTIPSKAASRPEQEEAPEVRPYNISFAKYKTDECQITGIEPNNGTAALTILRDIGVYFTDQTNFQQNCTKNIEIKHIVNAGDYGKLYRGLDLDEEVKEIKHSQTKKKRGENIEIDIRLFFYTIEHQKTFYVLAIRKDHYDTSKGFRD